MYSWWSRTVARVPWLVLVGALVLAGLGLAWGSGVFGALTSGGFDDPNSESVRASERISAELGKKNVDLVVLYSSETLSVKDPAFRDPVTATASSLRQRPEVANVVTYYDTQAPALVSEDGHATYAAITLTAPDEDSKSAAFEDLDTALRAPGLTTQVGGIVAFQTSADEMTERDIMRGEMLALPVVMVLLVLIFGGLVAAAMPLLIGILSILAAFTTTRLLTTVTDVSTFAVNTVTLLGLGMAIDYSLLMVSRFREELRAGNDTPEAIRRTMTTAGRTVLVSGLTIALSLASLLIFPQVFLRSMGMGGIAAVVMAMAGALTVLPAMLALLGERIDSLRIPLPWRRRIAQPSDTEIDNGAWASMAHSVMRRPILYIVGVGLLLAAVALPFLGVRFSGADERVVPPGTEARVVSERVASEFHGGTVAPIETYIDGASTAQVQELTGQIQGLPGVTGTDVTASRSDSTLVSVSYTGARTGDSAQDTVRAIRDLPIPPSVEVLVGGRTAGDVDRLTSLADRLPWMAAVMAAATLVLLFLAFGSVVLPVKAILMNLVSIGASFGVMVWVFQEGHLADWLGFTPTGFLEPTIPILVLVILFGLSTDYEVFLISRVREEWDATGDNRIAVARGVQRTGRIITAAALLLMAVVAGFATGDVVFAKMIGIGMIVAILVDATLVRMLLVPAAMRLLGRWNWWAPPALASVYHRFGLRDSAEPMDRLVPPQLPSEPSAGGRQAAPAAAE